MEQFVFLVRKTTIKKLFIIVISAPKKKYKMLLSFIIRSSNPVFSEEMKFKLRPENE